MADIQLIGLSYVQTCSQDLNLRSKITLLHETTLSLVTVRPYP